MSTNQKDTKIPPFKDRLSDPDTTNEIIADVSNFFTLAGRIYSSSEHRLVLAGYLHEITQKAIKQRGMAEFNLIRLQLLFGEVKEALDQKAREVKR